MFRSFNALLAGGLAALICSSASAQIIAIPLITWKYSQPWTAPWHSHDSVVRDCQGNPVPFADRALDDWICTASGPIIRVRWWGTSPQPNQLPNRQFLIRIYQGTTAACQPLQPPIYSVCVLPSKVLVGHDCFMDRQVWRFQANLPTPFTQQAGNRYWLQISEVDGVAGALQSPTLNAIDFEWSAHRNIKNCPAGQLSPAGVWTAPLFDACDGVEEDLAFVLYRSAIIVHVPVPVNPTLALPLPSYTAEFRRQGTGQLEWREQFSPDDDGSASLQPELRPGMYRLEIRGMGFRPSFFDVFVDFDGNYQYDLGNVAIGAGDVDGDGDTDFADLTGVLANWRP
jgi:hypothetical protein